jgi:hypothetical protein
LSQTYGHDKQNEQDPVGSSLDDASMLGSQE